MSTEHQQYSLDNQQAVISAYAESRQFTMVNTYTDGARSFGVVLKRRSGLRQLLQDVMDGNVAYKAILVYDVSPMGSGFRIRTSPHIMKFHLQKSWCSRSLLCGAICQ